MDHGGFLVLGVDGAVVCDGEGCFAVGADLGDVVFGGGFDLVDEVVDDVDEDDFVALGRC